MAVHAALQVLTANRLGDGRVVYLGKEGWTTKLEEARVLQTGEEADSAEQEGREAVAARLVVEPYLIEVEPVDLGVVPTRLRERIRADGPTTGHSRAPQAA